ncbi:VWA domain-containing protein [Candidatus Sumerlaeota bacterium]|nr:VWA domain-containing protein [Candidatus Sumerlaeota bacterium]MBI3735672.1 VWA domain-containing protein [Candidatus Sumerlaeota bacterium]
MSGGVPNLLELFPPRADDATRQSRWRLVLGGGEADGIGCGLSGAAIEMDQALAALYDAERGAGLKGGPKARRGGTEGSAPTVARWLGDIRKFFPSSVVRVMQKDAMERLNLRQLLLEREMLENIEPDIHLVSTLISLSGVIPQETKETARMVVRKVVDELMRKLETPLRNAITGSLNRAARTNRPRHNDIDWNRTIRANLKHYQEEYKSIIPQRLVGFGRRQPSFQRHIILCIDQSGSMASSVVYSSICGAVMASLPSVKTHFVVFDTSVVDLTDKLQDPVDVLFGTQLGGGTDINRAIGYCETLVEQPDNTILVLISDLIEGGVAKELLKKTASLVNSGVQMIALLALSDEGAPSYDAGLAAQMTSLGVPAFACTPDLFPDLMAAAIQKLDIGLWAAQQGIPAARSGQ